MLQQFDTLANQHLRLKEKSVTITYLLPLCIIACGIYLYLYRWVYQEWISYWYRSEKKWYRAFICGSRLICYFLFYFFCGCLRPYLCNIQYFHLIPSSLLLPLFPLFQQNGNTNKRLAAYVLTSSRLSKKKGKVSLCWRLLRLRWTNPIANMLNRLVY